MGSIIFRATIFCAVIVGFPFLASAETLSLSPASGSYALGQVIPVRVYVSSPSKPVNAFSASLQFPADSFQVTSISKAGSIVTLWVEEPTFSNTDGTIKFEGIIPNPGYTGSSGNLVTINFKPKKQGVSEIKFSGGQVLANDGNGTNILKNLAGATYTIGPAVEVPKPQEPVKPVEKPVVKPVETPVTPEPVVSPQPPSYLSWLLFVLALLLLIITIWDQKRIRDVKKKIKNELEEMETVVDQAFEDPKTAVQKNIETLERDRDGKGLSYEAGKTISTIKESLADTEKKIVREIRKTEKSVEND